MKSIIIFIIVFISNVCYSQTIDGIDITDLNNTNGWDFIETFEDEDYYNYGNPLQFFDEAGLFVNTGIVFYKYEPTGMNFYDIYKHLVSQLGDEDSEDDYIPTYLITLGWQNDYSTLSTYINLQEARIKKYWFHITKNENGELSGSLVWEYNNMLKEVSIIATFSYSSNDN